MRQLTQIEIDRIAVLTQQQVEVALIEPTETALNKSIMDATAPFRYYLKNRNIHDYQLQKQGPDSKILFPACFIGQNNLMPSMASLYRPETKKGDPRIWFKGLTAYAQANDILGVFLFEKMLFVLNISSLDIAGLVADTRPNPLKEIISSLRSSVNVIADELLFKLRKIAASGYVPALLNADTAIGRTLEHLLDIKANSSKKPDYKGIELKSFRDKRNNRKNLFGQIPVWSLSKFKSSADILDNFGYWRNDVFRLYCTVSAQNVNSQGLSLRLDAELEQLIEFSNQKNIGDFAVWTLEKLHTQLLEKHNETFWVAADSIFIDGLEHFLFKKAEHTRKPPVMQFDLLLQQGKITIDHLIKRQGNSTSEKGPSFKLKFEAMNVLFPRSLIYDLLD